MEKERQVILEELAMIADSPPQQVDVLLDETLWPDQPLGRDVAGSEASVRALTRDMAFDYLHAQYVPNNVVVSIAGAVGHGEAVENVDNVMGDWTSGQVSPWFPATNGQVAPRVSVKYKATQQAHMSLAVRGLPLQHPDRYALNMLSAVLGEGMSSRLVQELRERRSLCYDVHSYVSYFLDTGAFAVYTGVDPGRVDEALSALLGELARVRDEGVTAEELSRARELVKGRLLLRMEDSRAVSDWLGGQELLTGTVRTVDEVIAQVDAVSEDNVRRIARHLLTTEQLNLAVVGPFRSERRFLSLLKF
jgi:predicted Zn-dependent peptidase